MLPDRVEIGGVEIREAVLVQGAAPFELEFGVGTVDAGREAGGGGFAGCEAGALPEDLLGGEVQDSGG